MPANRRERPTGAMPEPEAGGGPQPEVEVIGQRVAVVIPADLLVDAAVDHARRIDQVVVAEEERVQQLRAREVAAWPLTDQLPGGVDDRAVAVDHTGVGEAVEQIDLTADPPRQGEVVVAEHRDQLAAPSAHEGVVGGCDTQVGLMPHHPQTRLRRIAGEHLVDPGIGRAVDDHKDLERLVVLVQAAVDRRREVGVAVVGCDPEGYAGRSGHAAL